MSEDDLLRTAEGRIILFLLDRDIKELKRTSQLPYGLRRGGESAPFTLPTWHPRQLQLGKQFSTLSAKERYVIFMRSCGLIPQTPPEQRIHLYIPPEQTKGCGFPFDREREAFFVPDTHPDVEELKLKYCREEDESRWREWRQALKERSHAQYQVAKSSDAHLFSTIIEPKRGPKPGQERPARLAWSFFQDLARGRIIDSHTPQIRVFTLIANELPYWGIRLGPDAIRKQLGVDWRAEIAKLRVDDHTNPEEGGQ